MDIIKPRPVDWLKQHKKAYNADRDLTKETYAGLGLRPDEIDRAGQLLQAARYKDGPKAGRLPPLHLMLNSVSIVGLIV